MTPSSKFIFTLLQRLSQRLLRLILTLLVICFMAFLGLVLYRHGQAKTDAEFGPVLTETLTQTASYLFHHPATYLWHKTTSPAFEIVGEAVVNSLGLLLVSTLLAVLVGVPLGIWIAFSKRRSFSSFGVVISVLGASTPSFLLAMLLGIANLRLSDALGLHALPPSGFGWDLHMIMPALVLAARPLAQITQVTYVTIADVLGQDYVRVATAKGLSRRQLRFRHVLRTALIPVLTTVGSSLRLSIASLPVVEYFYRWTGLGQTLLSALELNMDTLVVDLFLSLGLIFLAINLALDLIYPLLDPRVGRPLEEEAREEKSGFLASMRDFFVSVWGLLLAAVRSITALRSLPGSFVQTPKNLWNRLTGRSKQPASTSGILRPAAYQFDSKSQPPTWWRTLKNALTNPALILGGIMVVGFVFLALFGSRLTSVSPFKTYGVMKIDGKISSPPFKPSTEFTWGTDHIGRDIQALVLSGARQTLALGFYGMLARVLVGTLLGVLAGWRPGSWFDRLVMRAIGIWAAFPATIFAMILILGMGIQNGMSVFVIALAVVGWDGVAQVVRSKVLELRPKEYIEAAYSVGSRPGEILANHILPNLMPTIILLGVLEMGGVLMLLAELGMLNVYLGGGFKVEIAVNQIAYYSDVPEWGAMLANIRQWWRSYPWMALYPGTAVFLAILSFNVFGEGLRHFLDDSRFNTRRFNQAVIAFTAVCALGMFFLLHTTAPLGVYKQEANRFNLTRALLDLRFLTEPELDGRAAGSDGAAGAANYIAAQMEAAGLLPAGQKQTFLQAEPCSFSSLAETPTLVMNNSGQSRAFRYRRDFIEASGWEPRGYMSDKAIGAVSGTVVGVAVNSSEANTGLAGDSKSLDNQVVIVRAEQLESLNPTGAAGILAISEDRDAFTHKNVISRYSYNLSSRAPVMLITPAVADELLKSSGSSLQTLDSLAQELPKGSFTITPPGAEVKMNAPMTSGEGGTCYNVIGILPGSGASMGSSNGEGMDNEVIIVSAYYDGLGRDPDGVLYPGVNDNASGVATLLEMARTMKESQNPPKKTVLFVAWGTGERGEGLNTKNIFNAMTGLNQLHLEAVLELSGVGSKGGQAIALGSGSSYRLVKLYERAAARLGTNTTTLGQSTHTTTPIDRGGRTAMTIYVSWDGAAKTAHTWKDDLYNLDPEHILDVGRTTLLELMVMSHEMNY